MRKIWENDLYDPWTKRPRTYAPQTKTFELVDGGSITLHMQRLGQLGETRALERGAELVKQFISGDEMLGERATAFPPIGGEPVEVTEMLLHQAAMLECMQPDDAPERMNARDLVAMLLVEDPGDVRRIQKWANDLNKPEKKDDPEQADVPNGSGEAMPISSEPPSSDTSSILKSRPASILCSGVSTIAPAPLPDSAEQASTA